MEKELDRYHMYQYPPEPHARLQEMFNAGFMPLPLSVVSGSEGAIRVFEELWDHFESAIALDPSLAPAAFRNGESALPKRH